MSTTPYRYEFEPEYLDNLCAYCDEPCDGEMCDLCREEQLADARYDRMRDDD